MIFICSICRGLSLIAMTCQGLTKAGVNCKIRVKEGEFCRHHNRNQEEEVETPVVARVQCKGLTLKRERCKKFCLGEYCNLHIGKEGNVETKVEKRNGAANVEKKVNEKKVKEKTRFCIAEGCAISVDDHSRDQNFCKKHKNQYRFECEEECPICTEELDPSQTKPLECGHWMHRSCLLQWKSEESICPVCRQSFKLTREEKRQRRRDQRASLASHREGLIHGDDPTMHIIYRVMQVFNLDMQEAVYYMNDVVRQINERE